MPSSTKDVLYPYKILLLGNPGVGKSTVASSIIGTAATFKAGLSTGSGLTQHIKFVPFGDLAVADSPGLADTKIQKQAALEITKALKTPTTSDGLAVYVFIFVVTEESCRIRPSDLFTIQEVMGSIKTKTPPTYNVLFNKVTKTRKEKMRLEYKQVLGSFSDGGLALPATISFTLRENDAEDATNHILAGGVDVYPTDLNYSSGTSISSFSNWHAHLARSSYKIEKVEDIKTLELDAYKKQVIALKDLMAERKKDMVAQNIRLEKAQIRMAAQYDKQISGLREDAAQYDKQISGLREDATRARQDAARAASNQRRPPSFRPTDWIPVFGPLLRQLGV